MSGVDWALLLAASLVLVGLGVLMLMVALSQGEGRRKDGRWTFRRCMKRRIEEVRQR